MRRSYGRHQRHAEDRRGAETRGDAAHRLALVVAFVCGARDGQRQRIHGCAPDRREDRDERQHGQARQERHPAALQTSASTPSSIVRRIP